MNPPRRLPRALVLAAAGTAVGAASHVLSGRAVGVAGALAALVVLLALAWPLSGRERGWLALVGGQLAGQQIAHVLFGLGAAPANHGPGLPADAWFFAHVAAALLVATWLRWGERRSWAAARRAAAALSAYWRRLLAHGAPPAAAPPEPAPAVVDDVPSRRVRPLRGGGVRRGPPLPA